MTRIAGQTWYASLRTRAIRGIAGACGGARLGAFSALSTTGRKEALHRLVQARTPIRVLGYINGEPVGWCSIAPRETYAALERSRIVKRTDDQPVWAVVCFFLDRSVRGQDFTLKLLQAAIQFARAQGARTVEGYPMEHPARCYRWRGSPALFRRAGFREAGQPSGGRLRTCYEFQEPGASSFHRCINPFHYEGLGLCDGSTGLMWRVLHPSLHWQGAQLSVDAQERLHNLRIELRAGAALDLGGSLVVADRPAVAAVVGEGVEGVDHGEDAGAQVDVFTAQALRIAAAVIALLVVQHNGTGFLEKGDAGQHLITEFGMAPHNGPFLLGQRTGLAQDGVGHADLADIM